MSEPHSRTSDSHSFQYEKRVFVSYAWGGESEKIVNRIDQALQMRGIKIIRDKRDLGFKGSIRQFMERIGWGYCVIVVISDEYLRSPNCMFELVEIAEAKQFYDRVFPVVLSDANIYDPLRQIEYIKYWESKRTELAVAMGTVDPANLQGIRDDMDLYDRIRDKISGLTSTLRDMNTLTPELHREGDYSILVNAITKRLGSIEPLQREEILDRRLDAAMPKECQVGHTTEVRVLIALRDSIGLKAFLPDYTESGELIVKGDVEGSVVPIEFPYNQNTDRILPINLYIAIDAPNFQIRKRVQQVFVPPEKDSGMLTFFLTPSKPLSIGRVSVRLYRDKDCSIALGSVTLTTTVSSQWVEGIAGSWQLTGLGLNSHSSLIPSDESVLVGTSNVSKSNSNENHSKRPRPRIQLAVEMKAAILGAVAVVIAALIGSPYLFDLITNTPVPASPTPACVSTDEILIRLHVLKSTRQIAVLAPSERITLGPNQIVDLRVNFESVSGQPVPALECTWKNANSGTITSQTEGTLLHTAGCTIDYQSGRTKIADTLYLQVTQVSCPDLPSYSFFVLPP